MEILGFIENSFVDWDGKVSAVIFLGGCNFKCPFCQNYPIVKRDKLLKRYKANEILEYLKNNQKFIDGVVITGGEPLINPGIFDLVRNFKEEGFLVKLDTNGYFYFNLLTLIKENLVDYVAMDIKTSLKKYHKAAGIKIEISLIKDSIELLKEDKVDYEFRTTLVPKLVTIEDLFSIKEEIKGAKRWVLQKFVNQNAKSKIYQRIEPYTKEEAENLLSLLKSDGKIKEVYLRGY
ncbi:MAG: anaerobic ribonucleoside-triphosphate reductase activating protein [candidate division WOR-3 bacterium]|nr:anaerobic ribonucleoside-triphosphate reductase activating protein [candidate division WOR-3 bacterium]